jgi:hypothetical protein
MKLKKILNRLLIDFFIILFKRQTLKSIKKKNLFKQIKGANFTLIFETRLLKLHLGY